MIHGMGEGFDPGHGGGAVSGGPVGGDAVGGAAVSGGATGGTLRPALLIIAISVLPFVSAGCDAGPAGEPGVVVADSSGVRIVENETPGWAADEAWYVTAEPRVRIGVLEGAPEYQLDRVTGATILSDGRVAVADMGSSQVRFFDPDGRYLSRIGQAGDGPGEFRQITGLFRLPDDRLAVKDRGARIHLFRPDGTLLGAVQLGDVVIELDPVTFHENPPANVVVVSWPDDSSFVGYESTQPTLSATREFEESETLERAYVRFTVGGSDGRGGEAPASVDRRGTFSASDGQEIVRLAAETFHPHPRNVVLAEVFGAAVYHSTTDDALILGLSAPGELHWYTLDGRLERIARRVWSDRPVTSDMIEGYVRRSSPPLPEALARERTFGERLPAFSALRVDEGGHVWVREYEPEHAAATMQYIRTPDGPSNWSVFDATGRWMGTVELPPRFALLEVAEDHLLGLRRDELDVEYVEIYDLLKP